MRCSRLLLQNVEKFYVWSSLAILNVQFMVACLVQRYDRADENAYLPSCTPLVCIRIISWVLQCETMIKLIPANIQLVLDYLSLQTVLILQIPCKIILLLVVLVVPVKLVTLDFRNKLFTENGIANLFDVHNNIDVKTIFFTNLEAFCI